MQQTMQSIRPFIGARDFVLSRQFYRDLGFEEVVLSDKMVLFKKDQIGFYLQDAYVKDWIDNTMIFLEVADVDGCWKTLAALQLSTVYSGVKLSGVKHETWGKECFLHDPSGVLLHFGQFNAR